MSAKIKNITLSIGDREITLTMDEAKQLHRELENVFGSKATIERIIEKPVDRSAPIPPWQCPPFKEHTDRFIC